MAAEVNTAIDANLDVTEEMVSLNEAARDFNITRLPDGVESVRIVHIGDYDSCPCIGEHVDNTAKIGKFQLVSHDFNDGVLRIRYKPGEPQNQ